MTARERLDAIEALLADVREDADLAAEPSYTTANIVSKHLAEKRTLQEHVPAMRAALAALVAGHRTLEQLHRPVHPDWVRNGERVCEECTDAAAYAAGAPGVAWPCRTAASVAQKLGAAS